MYAHRWRTACRFDHFPGAKIQKEVIYTLALTIAVEGAIGCGYSLWRKKPVVPILITSIVANLITQSLLWVLLNLFFDYYLITLFTAEILIWMIESILLYAIPAN